MVKYLMKANGKSTISENINKYPQKLGISENHLSKLADVTYNTIIKTESGANKNPIIKTLAKIDKALGVGVDDLIK